MGLVHVLSFQTIEAEEQRQKVFPPKRLLQKEKNRNRKCSVRRDYSRSRRTKTETVPADESTLDAETVPSEEIAFKAEERKYKLFAPKRMPSK
jgi:hypothetical protein